MDGGVARSRSALRLPPSRDRRRLGSASHRFRPSTRRVPGANFDAWRLTGYGRERRQTRDRRAVRSTESSATCSASDGTRSSTRVRDGTAPAGPSRRLRVRTSGAHRRRPVDGGGHGSGRRRGPQPRHRRRGVGAAPRRRGRDPCHRAARHRPQAARRDPAPPQHDARTRRDHDGPRDPDHRRRCARSSTSPPRSRAGRSSTCSTSPSNAASIDFADLKQRLAARHGRPDHPPYKRCCPSTPPGPPSPAARWRNGSSRSVTTTASAGRTVNTRIEGEEVDFAWRDVRLVVEVDGYRYHRAPSRFESDRERDVVLVVAGWQVMRFTWTQLTTRAPWVAGAVSKRLAR